MGGVQFSNNYVLSHDKVTGATQAALVAIKNELPEEAHFYEVFQYVLNQCGEQLNVTKICL